MDETLSDQDEGASRFDLPSGFVCELRDAGVGTAWVNVAGELDIDTVPRLERILRATALRAQLVVLDLREVTFADSCGVRVMVYAGLRARRAARRLVLLRGPSQIQRLLALTGASDLLEIVDVAPGVPALQVLLQLTHADHAT
jgi:anti-sigma B factor antagonist